MKLRARPARTTNMSPRSKALRLGLSTCVALAGVMVAFSSSAAAAPTTPLVSTATSESHTGSVGTGTVLSVTYNTTPALASSYSLTLTDGTNVATLSSPAGLTATVSGNTIAFTVHTAASLSLSALEILAATGVSDGSGNSWNLVASGEVDKATSCKPIPGFTRVFGGSNCSIGFGAAGPTTPDVYDNIALRTQDLPGPPNDSAPEVITNCGVGSTDTAYDLSTGAQLGSNACGNNPPGETSIGNTNSNTLDYIPTPSVVSYEQVGVVETLPGSTYVSATAVPPQLSAITVSGNQATFFYYEPVVCQANSADQPTISQFAYVSPSTKTTLAPGDLVYPTAISCPSSGGATSITLTYPNTIPVSATVRFKYEGYGDGHFITGAPGTIFAGEREASQSAFVGPSTTGAPSAAITSFTPPSTTFPTSGAGTVDAAFATTNASSCTIAATSQPTAAAALTLPSVASCNGTGTITVPANTSTTSSAVYTVTLTANGTAGTTAATAPITITVPAAPLPAPVNLSAPTIAGTPVVGRSLTATHGSWSNSPTTYTDVWEDCDVNGNGCLPNGTTGTSYLLTTTDVGHTVKVQETAGNVSGGPGAAVLSAPSGLVGAAPPPAPVNAAPPTVSGTTTQGQLLTESHGSWSNAPTSYSYQWERCSASATSTCNAIGSATGPTYTLGSADVGSVIRVIETAHNGSPTATSATSLATATVRALTAPAAHLVTAQVSSSGRSATFTFTATGTSSGFQCALVLRGRNGRTPSPSYSACASPKAFANLRSGSYVFYVRATGPGGTGSAVTYSFTIR